MSFAGPTDQKTVENEGQEKIALSLANVGGDSGSVGL